MRLRQKNLNQFFGSTFLAAVLVLLGTFSCRAQDSDFLRGPPPGEVPLKVQMGFNLVDITDVSEKEETIDFEGAIYLEWTDPRLAYAPADVGMSEQWTPGDYSRAPKKIYLGEAEVNYEFKGWYPRIVIPNGIGDRNTTDVAISVWPDGHIAYSETFYIKAETPMDLRRFPFDTQDLEIFFHPFVYQRDEIVLVPDNRLSRAWEHDPGIADWSRESVTVLERPAEIAYFDDNKHLVSEFVVTIQVKRRPTHFLISILLPMVLLVSLTWCVFWMDNETLSTRVNMIFIGILSVVAYYFVILGHIPEAAYLTLTDAFILSTFLILAAGVVLAVTVERLEQSGRKELVLKVDRICRWAFPLGYAVSTLLLAYLFLGLQ